MPSPSTIGRGRPERDDERLAMDAERVGHRESRVPMYRSAREAGEAPSPKRRSSPRFATVRALHVAEKLAAFEQVFAGRPGREDRLARALDAVRNRDDKEIKILLVEGETILLSIEDNGTGLKDPDKLFDPFYTTKKPGEGLGLGLLGRMDVDLRLDDRDVGEVGRRQLVLARQRDNNVRVADVDRPLLAGFRERFLRGRLQVLGLRKAPEGFDSRNWHGADLAPGIWEAVRWFDIDPCFVFHTLNAYEDGDTVQRNKDLLAEYAELLEDVSWPSGLPGTHEILPEPRSPNRMAVRLEISPGRTPPGRHQVPVVPVPSPDGAAI